MPGSLAQTGITRTIVRLTSAYASIAAFLRRQTLGTITKPSDLPVEQISAYELIIGLRVAREPGARVSRDLLRFATV